MSCPYGFCPTCGAPVQARERRPNGNDHCKNGHVYPASQTVLERRGNEVMASRSDVYAAINSERDYQDKENGNAARHQGYSANMHPAEFITYMRKCLDDAQDSVYTGVTGARDCLRHIRKVTALGVKCMEQHGAPRRDSSL